MLTRGQIRIERSRNVLDRRAGFRLNTEWGHVAVLEGGGHICELGLKSAPGVSPLWKPQWKTMDPERYSPGKYRRIYGPPPDGKLLAGIAGHSISFDHFGPPSKEEAAAGLATHGEAPNIRWKQLKKVSSAERTLCYGCTLPSAQINFQRTLAINKIHPVVDVEERAENLSRYDRPISWNEHVTFGPPFLECGTTIFDMSAMQAKVCPAEYSENMFLEPNAEFLWPNAPRKDGGTHDLRMTPDERFGHYTAQLLDSRVSVGFISACNPRQRLIVVYLFRRTDFPWVGNWEERHNRPGVPWKGKTFCRGLEFSTTPFAIPRRDTVDHGPLFGEPTYRWLPARSNLAVRFQILLLPVPDDFNGVKQVSIDRGIALLTEPEPLERQLAVQVGNFLQIERQANKQQLSDGSTT